MAKPNPKLKSSLYGRWQIVSKGQAFIEFRADGYGSFKLGKVQAQFDYRTKHHEGKRAAQFCWHDDDDDQTEGIGWVIVEGEEMTGTISIDLGDEREFVAKRAGGPPQYELAVDEAFPVIDMFIQHYGHIAIGNQDRIGFVVRAFDDDGGLVLDDDHAATLDEAMTALEKALKKWFRKQGIELEGKR